MLLIALRIIRKAIAVLGIIALLFSILFEIIPTLPNTVDNAVNAVHITNQQSALAERISKDALALTQPGDHSQAILELQVTLPTFEKNQNGLVKNDDPSLELPVHIPGDVQLLIIQSQSDYAALDSAARSILVNADPPINPDQLAIVQQHERPYFLEMNTISKVWQTRVDDNAAAFFQVELGFGTGMLALLVAYWVLGIIIQRISMP
jgi:hypothetical protein